MRQLFGGKRRKTPVNAEPKEIPNKYEKPCSSGCGNVVEVNKGRAYLRANGSWGTRCLCCPQVAVDIRPTKMPENRPAEPGGNPVDMTKIREEMNTAHANGIKWPYMTFKVENLGKLLIVRSGDASANAGGVNVKLDGTFIGQVPADGSRWKMPKNDPLPKRETVLKVMEVIREIAVDPAEYAAVYGRRTKNCCYCARELTEADSLAVGYGPICAEKRGRPHAGEASRLKAEAVKAPKKPRKSLKMAA